MIEAVKREYGNYFDKLEQEIKEKVIKSLVIKFSKLKSEEDKMNQLTQILERDETGKPILKLIPIKKTAVNTPTKKKFYELMGIFECGNWTVGGAPATRLNTWDIYFKGICLDAGVDFFAGENGKFGYANKRFYEERNCKIITPKKFYDIQQITPEMLKEINDWFEENKERA